ncbi:MAG: HAMP domain-containing histidine kinase [Candidatus Cloacimonetes bacterium]|nr:HAMP domain-containing histidine kinase [Candidatus Cloacimonadota bacterium]
MKFGKQLKILKNSTSNIIKLYFIIGSIVILLGFLLFTNLLSKDIQRDISVVPDLYAQFIGLPDNVNLENFLTDYFMTKIIPSIDYPIIFCDSLQVPFSWENINVESINYSGLVDSEKEKLQKMVKKLHKRGSYILLYKSKHKKDLIGYVYFGETSSMKQLRFMPFVASVLVVVFISVGAFALGYMRRNEKNQLWIGLAKETAHQFGTPTSSLLGWLSIMRSRLEGRNEQGESQELLEYIGHIETDVNRLQNVASRFGKVGSTIKLQETVLDEIIDETVGYFRSRVPQGSNKISIYYFSEIHDLKLLIDKDLIKWTLENLIKNAIDAMTGKSGRIILTSVLRDSSVQLRISDEGKGIPRNMFQRVFLAGVTSKERGWGLGLSLAKRIIEEYHEGKIRILQSDLKKGTTFEIILPVRNQEG